MSQKVKEKPVSTQDMLDRINSELVELETRIVLSEQALEQARAAKARAVAAGESTVEHECDIVEFKTQIDAMLEERKPLEVAKQQYMQRLADERESARFEKLLAARETYAAAVARYNAKAAELAKTVVELEDSIRACKRIDPSFPVIGGDAGALPCLPRFWADWSSWRAAPVHPGRQWIYLPIGKAHPSSVQQIRDRII